MAFLPAKGKNWHKWIAMVISLAQLGLCLGALLPAYWGWDVDGFHSNYFLTERLSWLDFELGSWGHIRIDYALGLDGISLSLVLLTAIILPIATLSSWNIDKQPKAYFMLLMLLNLSTYGVFCALDFFLFYLFFEFMLLPMFFLIGYWGGNRSEYAAIKFFIYTLFGSVLMLIVMVGLLFTFTEPGSNGPGGDPVYTLGFEYIMAQEGGQWANMVTESTFSLDSEIGGWNARHLAFLFLFIAFAIKIPVVPFHTWLPDAHVEAPTPISVILAALLLKVGAYGLIRVAYGFFPDGAIHYSWWIGLLGLISIIYGALVAMAQRDLKRMVAYSSVSHMGFVLLGLASLQGIGFSGAVFQLFTHGLISAMLFLLVGVIYDRVQDRQVDNFGGLWGLMPRYGFFTMIGFFASLGLPGLCAFISEVMVFMGAFQSAHLAPYGMPRWMPMVALLGIVLGAVYYLRAFRKMFFGEFDPEQQSSWREKLSDLHLREWLMLAPLAILILLLGIYPHTLTHILGPDSINWHSWVAAFIP